MHAGTHGFRMLTQMSLRLSADCKILSAQSANVGSVWAVPRRKLQNGSRKTAFALNQSPDLQKLF